MGDGERYYLVTDRTTSKFLVDAFESPLVSLSARKAREINSIMKPPEVIPPHATLSETMILLQT